MQLSNRLAVITGGAGGIGAACARRFAAEGARLVVVVDLDPAAARAVAAELDGVGHGVDVTDETALTSLLESIEDEHGPIDVMFSNAGAGVEGGVEAPTASWDRLWDLHVMSHVWAARTVLPSMIARGEGHIVQTASAAGLLAAIGSAPYTVTKHACVALAEWLSITHHDDGVGVSVLCPQGVNTAMAPRQLGDGATDGIIEPDVVAGAVVEAISEERFFVLPHPEVATYVQRKAEDPERWLRGMRKLRARSLDGLGAGS